MKKYKLKEEAKRFLTNKLNVQIGEVVQTLEDWEKVNFCIEALEEVPQRIELYGQLEGGYCRYLRKKDATHFTDKQRIICEKALNGELLDIDSFNYEDFSDWYRDEFITISWEILKLVKIILKVTLHQLHQLLV